MVAHTEASCVVMLLNQQNRGGERAGTRADKSFLQHEVYLGFNLLFLKMGVPLQPHINGFRIGDKVYMDWGGLNRGSNLVRRV